MFVTSNLNNTAGVITASGNGTGVFVSNGRNIVICGTRMNAVNIGNRTLCDFTGSAPIEWCKQQWTKFVILPNNPQSIFMEVAKRILIFIPLVVTTLSAALIHPFICCGQSTTIPSPTIAPVIGSGVVNTQRVELGNQQISSIIFSSVGELIVTKGETCSLTTQADDNIIPLLHHQLSESTLTLKTQKDVSFQTSSPIQYHLTIPHSISQITLHGAGKILLDEVNQKEFACTINGSGDVQIKEGITNQQEITINGSGNYLADALKSEDIRININGSGDGTVWATGKLSVRIRGSGDCHYRGHPTINKQISGSGSVTPMVLS